MSHGHYDESQQKVDENQTKRQRYKNVNFIDGKTTILWSIANEINLIINDGEI